MLRITICFLFVILMNICCAEDYKVVDGQTGKAIPATVAEIRNAFSFDARKLGGQQCAVISVAKENNPTSEIYVFNQMGVIVIGCTKIKDGLPKDDTLITTKITPLIDQYKILGKEFYTGKQIKEFNRLVVHEVNTSAELKDPNDLQFVINSNVFTGKKSGTTRVDRHFVKNGYYIQLVTFAHNEIDANGAENLSLAIMNDLIAENK